MGSITVSVTLVHGGADNRELCRAPATKTAFSQFQGGVSRGWGEVSEFVVVVVMGRGSSLQRVLLATTAATLHIPIFLPLTLEFTQKY